ncbi:MAG: M1 family metallopeptidase [Bacteroidota bacterium]
MYRLSIVLGLFLLISCRSKKEIVYEAPMDYEIELLDTLVVSAPVYDSAEEKEEYTLPVYRPEAERRYDLLHTKLELSFDWEKQHVLGKASLELTPLFYPIDEVVLDAKQFIIHSIRLNPEGQELAYDYDDFQLIIDLGREFKKGEEILLFIDYTAQPNEGPESGSAAITSDKGLFFINPTNENPNKPRQIWTQGETEHNSKWFPTFDKPNERCTQEIYLTVEENLETLSNGELVSSEINGDGTKTDYWLMDKPHTPYLFMLMVGNFVRVQDSWNGKQLEYIVYPEYESSAKKIFDHTPEMLTFFSDLLDYPYPWNKYSQVIAEDFVSGAMENTTAVVFGKFVQKTERELIDNENDQIVAHEMFHHWYGNLVTCESWANLTLNEGFGNYSEYLWYEHKYGKDAADAVRISEMEGYLFMADQTGTHPLIDFEYENKEDMFDAHSYNKGGLVLHMLRNVIGDDAFFTSMRKFLKDHEYTAVEIADLRLTFEEVTGMDLNWFFNQWFMDKGHPIMDISYDYKEGKVLIYATQTQDEESHRPIFVLPLEAAVYAQDGSVTYHDVVVDARKDTIVIEGVNEQPLVTVLDGRAVLLGEISEDRTPDEWAALIKYSPNHFDKRNALIYLTNTEEIMSLTEQLLNDSHHTLRNAGLKQVDASMLSMVEKMITDDAHSSTRAKAIKVYGDFVGEAAIEKAEEVLKKEQAYPPIIEALEIIDRYDQTKALMYADALKNEKSAKLVGFLTGLFAESGDAKHLDYIESNLENVSVYQVFNVFGKYSDLLLQQETDVMLSKTKMLKSMAINNGNMFRRYLATNTINSIREKLMEKKEKADESKKMAYAKKIEKLTMVLGEIIAQEKDESLVARYSSFQ